MNRKEIREALDCLNRGSELAINGLLDNPPRYGGPYLDIEEITETEDIYGAAVFEFIQQVMWNNSMPVIELFSEATDTNRPNVWNRIFYVYHSETDTNDYFICHYDIFRTNKKKMWLRTPKRIWDTESFTEKFNERIAEYNSPQPAGKWIPISNKAKKMLDDIANNPTEETIKLGEELEKKMKSNL